MSQGIILAFFLLTSKYYKTKANTWLALALILLSTLSILDVVGSEFSPRSIFLEFLLHDLELGFLVYVPLYYFFKISVSSPSNQQKFDFYLLFPFIFDTLINLGIVSFFPIETITNHTGIQLFYEVETLFSILFNSFLCYKSYQLLKTSTRSVEKKKWLHKIWQSTLVLIIAWILMTLSAYVLNTNFTVFVAMLYVLVSIWMFWLMYNGVRSVQKNIIPKKSLKSRILG